MRTGSLTKYLFPFEALKLDVLSSVSRTFCKLDRF